MPRMTAPTDHAPDPELSLVPRPGQPAVRWRLSEAIERVQGMVNENRFQQAGFVNTQLMRGFPQSVAVRLLMAEIWQGVRRFDRAAPLIEALLTECPGDDTVLYTAARYYARIREGARARALMERAVELKPGDDDYRHGLGYVCRINGDREAAVAALAKACELNPANVMAQWDYALLTREASTGAGLAEIERLADSPDMDATRRGVLHFAAAVRLRGRDVDAEFAHLDRANALIASQRPWDDAVEARQVGRIRRLIDRRFVEQLSASAPAGDDAPAPIFIVGLPRSGTTLAEQVLGAHPKVCPAGESEALRGALEAGGREQHAQGVIGQWLSADNPDAAATLGRILPVARRLFSTHPLIAAAAGRRVADKSIGNLLIAGIIPLVFPRARVIYMRRDPLDVVLSCYQLYFPVGHHYIYRMESIAKRWRLYDDWLAELGRLYPARLRTVSYDALVKNPEAEVRGLLDFCGLAWNESCLHFYRQDTIVETDGMMETRQPIHARASGRWRPYARHLAPAAAILGIDAGIH